MIHNIVKYVQYLNEGAVQVCARMCKVLNYIHQVDTNTTPN